MCCNAIPNVVQAFAEMFIGPEEIIKPITIEPLDAVFLRTELNSFLRNSDVNSFISIGAL